MKRYVYSVTLQACVYKGYIWCVLLHLDKTLDPNSMQEACHT